MCLIPFQHGTDLGEYINSHFYNLLYISNIPETYGNRTPVNQIINLLLMITKYGDMSRQLFILNTVLDNFTLHRNLKE